MMRPPITSRPVRQQGVALLLMMFIIGLAVTAYVVKSYDAAAMKARQEEKTMKALAEAKEALVAWSVAHPTSPGVMPFPDRGNDADGYDGKSDCVAPPDYSHLIGKLPSYSESGCFASTYHTNIHTTDSSSERLWYAVSMNLIRSGSKVPVINPGMLGNPYEWMKVVDANGNILSDRVAVVLIAPGAPIGNQNRAGSADVSNFLESAVDNNQTFFKKNEDKSFNDRLIYITIDELITALAKRVTQEIKGLMNFSADGVIKSCVLGDSGCSDKDTRLTWDFKGSYVVTPSSATAMSYFSDKTRVQIFKCTGKDSLECTGQSEGVQNGQAVSSSISLTFPLNGVGLGMQAQTIERIRAEGWKMEITTDGNKVVIHPTGANTSEQIEVRNPDRPSQDGLPDWYFNNSWDQYTDVIVARGLENECDVSCLTLLRQYGVEISQIKRLVLVRKNGRASNVSVPVVDELATGALAVSWILSQ